jgi:20S proteasome alpha/beta subunit
MTLVMGLKGKSDVVVAADCLAHTNGAEGMYKCKCKKLRSFPAGDREWVIGVAGAAAGITAVELALSEMSSIKGIYTLGELDALRESLKSICEARGFEDEMRFLVAGVDKAGPFVQELHFEKGNHSEKGKWTGPEDPHRSYGAIGASCHGAMYFASAFNSSELSESQRITLAHLCISEATKHDIRVDGPVDIAVAGDGKVRFIEGDELKRIEARTREIARLIGEIVLAPYGEIGAPANIDPVGRA